MAGVISDVERDAGRPDPRDLARVNSEARTESPARVFRRAVFFVAGFDPKGARFLYWMFRREFAAAARLEGRAAEVSALERDAAGVPGWRIETQDGAAAVHVDYTVLSPRDVVRRHYYTRNVFGLLAAYAVVVAALFRSGAALRIWRLPPRPVGLFLYALLAVPGFFWLGAELVYWPLAPILPAGAGEFAWIAGRIAGGLILLQALLALEGAIWLYFFVSALRLAALQARGRAGALDRLVEDWVRLVAARQDAGRYDEILLVGHSVGAIQAVEIAARLLDDPRFAGRLALVTLGATEMVLSFQKGARAFRDALAKVATAPALVWKDYYAETDALCRGGTDPIAAAGIDLGGRAQTGPDLRRVDLREIYRPGSPRRLPWNLVKQHFLYLMAGERVRDDGYFRLVCGARRLT